MKTNQPAPAGQDKLTPLVQFVSSVIKISVSQKLQNHHDSEDVIQDVFERIFVRREFFEYLPFEEQKKLARGYANNLCLDVFRRRRKATMVEIAQQRQTGQPPGITAQMDLADVLRILQNHKHSDCLLSNATGMLMKEIAARKKIKLNTALARSRYARNYLKKHYK